MQPTIPPTIYIGFGPRLGAFLIDLFVVWFVAHFVRKFYYGPYVWAIDGLIGPVDFLICWVFPFAYWVLLIHWMQATMGKKILDQVVVDAETHLPVGLLRLAVRYLASGLSALPLGLGFLWIVWDKRKQGWHDKLAGTVVIYRRPD